MIAVATIAVVWTALLVLIVGACRAARSGDEAQQHTPSSLMPDRYAAQHHPRVSTLPGLRSPHNLSAR
jgi:hypothetical protein